MRKIWAGLIGLALLLSACSMQEDEPSPKSPPGVVSGAAYASDTILLSDEETETVTQLVLQSAPLILDDYRTPEDIPVYSMVRFLFARMQLDGIDTGFERPDDSHVRVPLERVREYAAAYFGLSELLIDFASRQYFDGQSFLIPLPAVSLDPSFAVSRVEPGAAGRVSVTVDVSSGGILYQRRVYTLRSTREGSFVFASMIARPMEFGVYSINNASAILDHLAGVPVNSLTVDNFRFLPFGEQMLCMISNGMSLSLGYLDLQTYKSDQFVTLDDLQLGRGWDVQTAGDKILIYDEKSILVMNADLAVERIISYPRQLLALCDAYTTGFFLSPDLRYIAYTNAEGLQFYSIEADRSILMQSNLMELSDPTLPEAVWEPVAFTESNALLARLRLTSAADPNSFERLATFSTRNPGNAMVLSLRIRGDRDTLLSVYGDRLLVYAPTSVRLTNVSVETPLGQTCIDCNLVTGTARTFAANFPLAGSEPSSQGVFLSPDYLYRIQEIRIGEDMVSSLSLQTFHNPSDNRFSDRLTVSEFGYVDRFPSLAFEAVSSSGRLIVRCSGMFCHSIAVL